MRNLKRFTLLLVLLQKTYHRDQLPKTIANDSTHLGLRDYHQEEWDALPVTIVFAETVQCIRGIQQHAAIQILCPSIGIALVVVTTEDETHDIQTQVTTTKMANADSHIVDHHLALEHIPETRGRQQQITRVRTSAVMTQP
jgi:hypothetical protein